MGEKTLQIEPLVGGLVDSNLWGMKGKSGEWETAEIFWQPPVVWHVLNSVTMVFISFGAKQLCICTHVALRATSVCRVAAFARYFAWACGHTSVSFCSEKVMRLQGIISWSHSFLHHGYLFHQPWLVKKKLMWLYICKKNLFWCLRVQKILAINCLICLISRRLRDRCAEFFASTVRAEKFWL